MSEGREGKLQERDAVVRYLKAEQRKWRKALRDASDDATASACEQAEAAMWQAWTAIKDGKHVA